jgi:hypothetical protein
MASQTDWRGLFGPPQQLGGLFAPPQPMGGLFAPQNYLRPLNPDAAQQTELQAALAPQLRTLDGLPSMRSHDPTLRERVGNAVYDFFNWAGLNGEQARRDALAAVDFVPGLSQAVGSEEVGRAYGSERYLDAALGTGGLLLGMVPAVGPPAGRGLRRLPMDETSRTARAKEMGFGPGNWYHGTNKDVAAFDPGAMGSATGSPVRGFSFTRSPDLASDFAKLAAVRQRGGSPNVIPARLRWDNPAEANLKGAAIGRHEIAAKLAEAVERGHDALILRNVKMKVGRNPARVSDIAIVLRPEQIRSVLAKFDPKHVSSGDLLAGLAAAGLLLPLTEGTEALGSGDRE